MATAINGNDIRDMLALLLARKLGKNIDSANITVTMGGEAHELGSVVFGVCETTPRKGRRVGYNRVKKTEVVQVDSTKAQE